MEGIRDERRFRQLLLEEAPRFLARAAPDDVEELTGSHVDELGGELLAPVAAGSPEQHLVEPEGVDGAVAGGVVDEQLAIGADSMRTSSSVQLFIGHSGSAQRKRRLCQHSRVGRPRHGKPTKGTSRFSFSFASTPQDGQPTGTLRDSMWISTTGPSRTPSTSTFESPTRISHIRRGSRSSV
jgi:hypothetical protein